MFWAHIVIEKVGIVKEVDIINILGIVMKELGIDKYNLLCIY